MTFPSRGGDAAVAPNEERGEDIWNLKGDEEPPPPTEEGKALSFHKEAHRIMGRAEEETERRKGIDSSANQKNRHGELTQAENYAC